MGNNFLGTRYLLYRIISSFYQNIRQYFFY